VVGGRPRWHHDLRDGLAAILAQPMVRPLFGMAVISPLFGRSSRRCIRFTR